jgi:hypothetical protein
MGFPRSARAPSVCEVVQLLRPVAVTPRQSAEVVEHPGMEVRTILQALVMLGRVAPAGKGYDRDRTMAACPAGPYGSRYGPGETLEGGEVPLSTMQR